jgi:hypothetical protein
MHGWCVLKHTKTFDKMKTRSVNKEEMILMQVLVQYPLPPIPSIVGRLT